MERESRNFVFLLYLRKLGVNGLEISRHSVDGNFCFTLYSLLYLRKGTESTLSEGSRVYTRVQHYL